MCDNYVYSFIICVCYLKLHAWQLHVFVHICVCDLKLHVTTPCILAYLCVISYYMWQLHVFVHICVWSQTTSMTTMCIFHICVLNYMCDNCRVFVHICVSCLKLHVTTTTCILLRVFCSYLCVVISNYMRMWDNYMCIRSTCICVCDLKLHVWQLGVFFHICVLSQTTMCRQLCVFIRIHTFVCVCYLKLHVTTTCIRSYLCVCDLKLHVWQLSVFFHICVRVISNYMCDNYM